MATVQLLTPFNYQPKCLNCGWTGKVHSTRHRAESAADVHNMVWHADGSANVISIEHTDSPVNNYPQPA